MIQQGQVFKLKAKGADGERLWAYRYRLKGRSSARRQVGGFTSRAEAQKALRKALDRVGPGRGGAITLAELVEEYLELHQAEPVTIAKLRWLLGKATSTLGGMRVADISPKDVYAWRLPVPEGHRFEATQALRQVLNRAVAWGLLDFNPAKLGVPNPERRPKEKRPFESWAQIEEIAARLGSVHGPMVIFGAATGLRPSELFGLEQHDVDLEAGVVYVRRAFANGRIKNTKTRLSTRAVPLQAKAVEALDRLPASVNPILFPNVRGGRIDFRIFGRRHWRPAQIAALVRGREEIFFGAEFDASAGTKKLPAEVVSYYVDTLAADAEALRGSFELYRAFPTMIAQNEQRKTRRLTMPVLAIGGEESGGERVAATMKLVADDVQSVVLPGAAHWVAEQAPEALLAALTEFLAPYRKRAE